MNVQEQIASLLQRKSKKTKALLQSKSKRSLSKRNAAPDGCSCNWAPSTRCTTPSGFATERACVADVSQELRQDFQRAMANEKQNYQTYPRASAIIQETTPSLWETE